MKKLLILLTVLASTNLALARTVVPVPNGHFECNFYPGDTGAKYKGIGATEREARFSAISSCEYIRNKLTDETDESKKETNYILENMDKCVGRVFQNEKFRCFKKEI
jgi:hypothetical protein